MTDSVPTSLSAFYYFMEDRGFPIISGAYEHGTDGFVCIMYFDPSVTLDGLWNFLRLPNLLTKTKTAVYSSDNSYTLSIDETGLVSLILSEKYHVSVLCYIMAHR